MADRNTRPVVQSDTAKTPASSATIGASSATVVAANPQRVSVTLCNDHATQIVYLALGATAVANTGIRLNAAGGTITLTSYTGIITGIATGASTVVTYSEV
jgi:hypothetical protein